MFRSCSAGPVTYVKGRRRRDYSPRPRPTPEEGTAEGIHIGASFAPSALVLFQSVLVINLGRLRLPLHAFGFRVGLACVPDRSGTPKATCKERDANPSPRSSHASPSRRSVMSCAFVATRQLMTVPTLLSATRNTPSNPRFAMRGAMGCLCSRSCSTPQEGTAGHHLREGKTKAGLLARPRPTPRRKERLKVSTSEPHLPPPL